MRVTNQITSTTILGDIQRTQQRILQLQRQAASGRRVIDMSDDPLAAMAGIRLQSILRRQEQYRVNVAGAQDRLEHADAAIADLTDVFNDMKALVLEMGDDTQTPESRQAAAQTVAAALNQVMAIANRQVDGRYLFSGTKTTTPPFASLGGGTVYQGDRGSIQYGIGDGQQIAVNVNGVELFGASSSQVQGFQDLNPAATTTTLLDDLNNGDGVSLGSVTLGDGTSTETIDLSGADSLGDVIDKLNSNTIGIVASITTTGGASGSSRITLTEAGSNITVTEVAGNTTAADLGILNTTGAGATLNGTDLDPALTDLTTVASLMNGTGITDLASGLSITNGSNSGTVAFTGLTTIQQIRNALNTSGLYVDARISSDGRKLDVVSVLNGAELRIGENAGTTATNLGLRSLYAGTSLSSLNRGQGVHKATVSTDDDFIITQRDGTTISVNIASATTLQDVITAINTDAENTGDLTASLNPSGNGIRLVDASAGATPLSVARLNDSLAAADLGIEQAVSGGGGTLTGADVNPIVSDSIFTILKDLQDALNTDNTAAINLRGQELDDAFEALLNQQAVVGGRLQRLEMADARLEQQHLQVESTLSDTLEANLTEVLTKLAQEQVSLQAGLQISALTLQLNLSNFL